MPESSSCVFVDLSKLIFSLLDLLEKSQMKKPVSFTKVQILISVVVFPYFYFLFKTNFAFLPISMKNKV